MRRLIPFAIAFTASYALAQAPPIEFKGFPLGGSAVAFQERFTSAMMCGPESCMGIRDQVFQLCSECDEAKRKRMLADFDYGPTTATAYLATFDDGRVGRLHVEFPSNRFDDVVAALVEKYGKPSTRRNMKAQNAFGASYASRVITWARKDGQIEATELSGSVNTSSVELVSAMALRNQAKRDRTAPAAAAKNL